MGEDVTFMGKEIALASLDQEMDAKTRRELKKHSATIHCSNTLSLLQRKISNALLFYAYPNLLKKEEHEISIKELCRLIGYHGNNHAVIKEALKELLSTVIEWNIVDDETNEEDWSASSILASVCLKRSQCLYAYSPRMKRLLYTPSMFGKIDLVIQSKFRSNYGLALYENCIRYRGLPLTKWFELDLFRRLMGIPDGTYEVFRDFKKRVLDKAIQEVNSHSDLIVEAEVQREGRKVARLRFKLKERAKRFKLGAPKVSGLTSNNQTEDVKRQLEKLFFIEPDQAELLLKQYAPDYILEKINLIQQSKSYKTGKIVNVTAYLLTALERNYKIVRLPSVQVQSDARANAEKPQKKLKEEIPALMKEVERLKQSYNQYREQLVMNCIDSMDVAFKNQFIASFQEFAAPLISSVLKLQRHKYNKETVMDSPQIKSMLRQFAIRELDFLVLPTFLEYLEEQSEEKKKAWDALKAMDPKNELLVMSS